ncbi:MAG: helicase C-terminal domain-containing protein [Planctomycetota bacterium]
MDPTPLPDAETLLAPEGPVAAALGAFEARPEQAAMARAVAGALDGGRHLLVEAGTGVGKSFAYLVPALVWAARQGKKVAVATSTIALQEQLVGKDLPLLAKALPFPVTFTLVKGRGNYLCLRRLKAAAEPTGELFPEEEGRRQLGEIDALAERGASSRQDLPFTPREDVWEAVRAESGNCLHRQCPYFARCGYQAARARAAEANVLVLNHHVLLADLALRRSGASFLPGVDAVIVDEAHDLEDAAAETLGARVGTRGVSQALSRLWNDRRATGLLARHPDPALRSLVDDARRASRSFFERVRTIAGATETGSAVVPLEGALPSDEGLADAVEHLGRTLALSIAPLSRDLALEVSARAAGLVALAETVRDATRGADEGHAAWIEADARGNAALLRAPVDAAPHLREALFAAFPTVVLTSATLAVGRPPSFRYARERLGVDDADEAVLGSPFDYARQARIVVRADLPDPARAPGAYEAALPDAVLEAVRRTDGGAFVLFTSYDAMRRTAAAIRADLVGDGLLVLVQGEELPRSAMLERFRADNSVLFGVSSFWQGVDVPGDALRNVVIARLPFEVPTHPLARARQARLERAGRSPFEHLSLPQAALKLKQGFGRLIRRATDRGLVVILDPRIVTKPYGRSLLGSLPACPIDVETGGDD